MIVKIIGKPILGYVCFVGGYLMSLAEDSWLWDNLMMLDCIEYFFLFAVYDMSLPDAFSLFLILNMKKLVTFKKLAISESLWLVVTVMGMACFFNFLYQIGTCYVYDLEQPVKEKWECENLA